MARIIINLERSDIGDLLLGGEIHITPYVQKFDNLTDIVIKYDEYNNSQEVDEND